MKALFKFILVVIIATLMVAGMLQVESNYEDQTKSAEVSCYDENHNVIIGLECLDVDYPLAYHFWMLCTGFITVVIELIILMIIPDD